MALVNREPLKRRVRALVTLVVSCVSAPAFAAPSWWQVSATLDFTPHGTQPGLTHAFTGSDNCKNCHANGYIGTDDRAFVPWDTWAGSMMANATRDPVFWAALDVANHDQPGVGDYCLRCHTPQGWYGGHVVKTGTGSTIDGSNGCQLAGTYAEYDGDTNDPSANSDYSGETCHYCHRLVAQGPLGQAAYFENANAWLDDTDCGGQGEPCRHGPYTYVNGGTVDPPPHPWAYSAYHQQSDVCGLCHNVTTPDTSTGPLVTLRDAGGNDTGIPFPIERTFREWQQSDFADLIFRDGIGEIPYTPSLAHAEPCQTCHMPNSTDPATYACTLENYGSRVGDLATHAFAGGNSWVPSILGGEYGTSLNRSAAFTQTIAAAQQMLFGAASVAVTPGAYTAPTAGSAGSLALTVRVTNLTGHKLPTGYSEGRRMWLDVQVRDAGNAVIAESGAYDAASGVLTQDPQPRVYEVLQGMWNGSACQVADGGGNLQFHFVLNNCIAKDNRIPPLGFAGGDDAQTQPVNQVYPAVGGNVARLVNYDDVSYNFDLPAGTALPLTVSATLDYQTASRDYIEFLVNEAAANTFPDENTLCAGAPNRPFSVGPQARTRAEYLHELWNNAASDAVQPGYGKSPPQQAGNVASIAVGG
jgi:hypothetical protein